MKTLANISTTARLMLSASTMALAGAGLPILAAVAGAVLALSIGAGAYRMMRLMAIDSRRAARRSVLK